MFSFSLVLILALVVITLAFVAFIQSRPIPLDTLTNDLAATSLDADFREFISSQRQNNAPLLNRDNREALEIYLAELSQNTSYRLLLVQGDQVLYDSAGVYARNAPLEVSSTQPLRDRTGNASANGADILFNMGNFRQADGQEWLFVARRLVASQAAENRRGNFSYLVAAPQPRHNVVNVLRAFWGDFFWPLCQAGGVGLGAAFLLSIWLTRSIARPLQDIAASAQKVAQGHYNQQVPVQGPQEAQLVARAFNEMTAQVQAHQQAQQDFLANITHDLRTPLTSIQGFSQAILDGVGDEKEAARIINEEAARLGRLVSDLLDMAKIQAGRWQMTQQSVEIQALLSLIGESLGMKARQKGVKLQVNIPPLERIAGDGDRLSQVFTNLLDNAIKHTDPGGMVQLKAKMQPGGVLIQVQDTGEGIPAEDLPRIFERFYQVDKSRHQADQKRGAGLGLAITREIVEAHGGKIWVESVPGMGSRFNVLLPTLSHDQATIIRRRSRTK
jgi:signal transduction histidine kinase